jgi:hypothetical protein
MSKMELLYKEKCNEPSDINEHLPTLYRYTKECLHVTECGVRGICSSYAFGLGLEGRDGARLVQIDPVGSDSQSEFSKLCESCGIRNVFYEQSDLECPMEETELLFIDTWHVYGQLKRELARWHPHVSKYIIMHDTTVDGIYGETVRQNMNARLQSVQFNMPVEEITKGLWPAIEEFLAEHPEWVLHERYTNNNGLTILKRSN